MQITNLILILSLIFTQILSWWENGHMLVSQIAKLELLKSQPQVYERANELIISMNGLDYDIDNTFVTSAVWPDDIKSRAMDFFDNWHFFDRPVNPSGQYIIQSLNGQKNNANDMLKRATEEFQDDDGQITFQKALFTRYILHVVGDLHQPLHGVTLFNSTFPSPTGDLAGNYLDIEDSDGNAMNLHMFWDSGAEGFQTLDWSPVERPLNDTAVVYMEDWAKKLMSEFPKSHFEGKQDNIDPDVWTREGWQIAKDQVYPLVYETNILTKEYEEKARVTCRERATLGGYRLANFLKFMLADYTDSEKLQKNMLKSQGPHIDRHDGMEFEGYGHFKNADKQQQEVEQQKQQQQSQKRQANTIESKLRKKFLGQQE